MAKAPIKLRLHVPVLKLSFRRLFSVILGLLFLGGMVSTWYVIHQKNQISQQTQLISQAYDNEKSQKQQIIEENQQFLEQNQELTDRLASVSADYAQYLTRDEYLINTALEEELENIVDTYSSAVDTYELLLKAKEEGLTKDIYDNEFTKALVALTERDYVVASERLDFVSTELTKELDEIAIAREKALAEERAKLATQGVSSNIPPVSGYSRQSVSSDVGTFTVDMVAGNLATTRVIVDTASDSDCGNECPVLSLAEYVSRNGAYAGINGSYFCPATYPSCAGKTNSFDTLLMNKNKTYFNSDNNVYSTVPAVIFGSGWVRFVGQSLEWGRDTGIDSMIANQPLLVSGGNVVFGGDSDPKKGSKSNRSFVASKGNTVYIGVVRNATVAESARVLHALGMDYGLNLDAGGSTAFWSGGYKAGPGRNIPNAILFVNK